MEGAEDLSAAEESPALPVEHLESFLPPDEGVVRRAHRVTALVLAHEGAPWLPRSLAALARQDRIPDVVLGIDAGSTDGSAALLGGSVDRVVALDEAPGIAVALARGVEAAAGWADTATPGDGSSADAPQAAPDSDAPEQVAWYWIVHDDCAPEPECLAELLAGSDRNPGAQVLVPKGVSWSDPARLIAIGNKWAPGTPVVERLESRERDQGQYDVDRPVYVGDSAGLLVRADVWHALGGMDPQVGDWAAAADLCRRVWGTGGEVVFIPDAIVAHRAAGKRGVRAGTPPSAAPRRAARRGQLILELTQAPGWALPWRYVRAWISTAVRAVVLLVTAEPEEATGQLAGAWDVLGHPARIRAARSSVRRTPVDLGRPPHVRAYRGAVVQRALDGWSATSPARERRQWRLPARVWQPLAVSGALAVAAIARTPEALFGSGTLRGGGLLPASGAMDLLSGYLSGWHDVRFGTPVALPAYLPLLSLGSAPLLGSVDLLLRLCFVLAVPLAFLSAYLSIGPVLVGRERMALALGYALLPAGAAAMGAGRLSTLGLLLLAPPTARLVVIALTRARRPGTGIRPAIAGGTMLGVTCAFAPLAFPLAVGAALIGWAVARFARWPVRNGLIVLGVAALFLAIWAPRVWAAPWLLLSDLGRNDPTLGTPEAWAWGLAPGGPSSVAWSGAPLLVVAVLAGALRPTRRVWLALACACALLAGVAWLPALAGALWPEVDARTLWPGQPLLVAGALLVLVVARTAADSGRLGIGATTAWWGCVGVLALGWWMSPSVMGVSQDSGLPPVVALDSASPAQPRALVLRRGGAGIHYAVATGPSAVLGEADALAGLPGDPRFDDEVQGLASGAGGDVSLELGGRGVRYVVFNGPQSDPVVTELDAAPGLRRLAASPEQSLWLVAGDPMRAVLTGLAGVDDVEVPVLSTPTSIDVEIHPATALPRRLVVAEQADPGWRGTLDGRPLDLAPDAVGVLAAPVLTSGALEVHHHSLRPWLAGAQLLLLAALAVIALPKRLAVDPDGEVHQ